jgi:hypothetical protein
VIRRRAVLLIALMVALATGLSAFQASWSNQKKDAKRDPNIRVLKGIVTQEDADAPVEGAVVQLKNLKTLQVVSYITKKDGKYIFQNLSTNVDYEVRSAFKDLESSTRTLSIYNNKPEAFIQLKLEPKK